MSNNPSVRKLKTDFQDFAKDVATDMRTSINLMADEIVENIKANAPQGDTGHLKASIRKKDVSTDTKLSVLVLGGGRLTTKNTGGQVYDYALATEFGTVKEAAEPFFYSTYRAYKAGGLEFFKETFEQTIEENNRVRGLRSSNFSNSSVTRSLGHRGAIVVHRR